MKKLTIVIADDNHVMRAALASYLQQRPEVAAVVEVAESGQPILDAQQKNDADLLIIEPMMSGFAERQVEEMKALHEAIGPVPILVLSAASRREIVLGMLKAGVSGYVMKDDDPDQLLRAIRAVTSGEDWVSPQVAGKLVATVRAGESPPRTLLTDRELEVLEKMAHGHTNDEIAKELHISENTVKNHVSHIFSKLEVETRVDAVLYALRHGLASVVAPKERKEDRDQDLS